MVVSLLMWKQPPKNIAPRSKYGSLKIYVNRIGSRGTLASPRCPSNHRDLLPQASGKKSARRDSRPRLFNSEGEEDELETFVGAKKTCISRRQLTTRSRASEIGCCPLDCASAALHLIGQLWPEQCYEY